MAQKKAVAVKRYKSGAGSRKGTAYGLLPRAGLRRAVARFQLGLDNYGDGAFNAMSTNTAPLADREWLIERVNHAIGHCYNLLDKLTGKAPMGGDDDAGAVAWCGLVLGEAMEQLERQ